jgi:predicted nucleotidyltransferase
MRLTTFERETILNVIHSQFGNEVKIWLFGSRVSDQKRGGDIDLFLETSQNFREAWQHKIIAVSLLQIQLGDQKIDVIVRSAEDADRPIYQIAKHTGILL